MSSRLYEPLAFKYHPTGLAPARGTVCALNFTNTLILREAFKKNNDETYGKFQQGGQQGVIFHMLSRKILNAQKAILSIFRPFYFFPLCTPPPPSPSTTIL